MRFLNNRGCKCTHCTHANDNPAIIKDNHSYLTSTDEMPFKAQNDALISNQCKKVAKNTKLNLLAMLSSSRSGILFKSCSFKIHYSIFESLCMRLYCRYLVCVVKFFLWQSGAEKCLNIIRHGNLWACFSINDKEPLKVLILKLKWIHWKSIFSPFD